MSRRPLPRWVCWLLLVPALLLLFAVDFEQALVLAIAALTTTGQLADLGAAHPIAYGDLSAPVKVVLGLAMVVGRLETLALLALVMPGRNRR